MTAVPTRIDATDTTNRPRKTTALIRVAVLDDHAAVRAGLEAILGARPTWSRSSSRPSTGQSSWPPR